jgi:hypothetical protein
MGRMGGNYGGASGDGLRRRLVLLVAIFACTYIFVTIQRGDWSVPRDWQDGRGPSVAQVNDAPWAAWRWVSSVRVYERGRAFLVDLQKYATEALAAGVQVVTPRGPSSAAPPERRPAP